VCESGLHQRTILLFVKNPEPGRVKTRLAAGVGNRFAAEIYRAFVEDVLAACLEAGVPVTVMVSPREAVEEVRLWLGSAHRYEAQAGDDLGERMSDAFRRVFDAGFGEAILVGSDIPDLRPEVLAEGFGALSVNHAVIAPAKDGGYYAVGFRSDGFQPAVFQGVEWSTDSVFTRTCNLMEQSRIQYHVLPMGEDVDTYQDLQNLMVRTEGTNHALKSRSCYPFLNSRFRRGVE
jgi:uncharacterized protein